MDFRPTRQLSSIESPVSESSPTVRVVAATPEQAARLRTSLDELSICCLTPEAGVNSDVQVDAALVVLEGMEAVAGRVAAADRTYLVALEASSPAVFKNHPVLPIHQPGALEAWVRLLTDLSGKKKLLPQLAHTDRLAAVGILAAGLAHEVNNPAQAVSFDLTELADVLRQIEHMVEDLGPSSPDAQAEVRLDACRQHFADVRDLVQECFDGLGRIAGIVRDLKGFSKIQTNRIDWVHPNEVVNQACAIAHNQIRHQARLIKELEATSSFPGDRNKLVQVVTNLLVNAVQSMPEGTEHGKVIVRTSETKDYLLISVIDNGPGIPPDVIEHIFEPFFTTKIGTGTGIGLALSLDIAQQHRGDLSVETEVGSGTRFDLMIPRENGLKVSTTSEVEPSTSPSHSGRVLVVDDEPGILRSIGRLIRRRHQVVTVGGGREAYELLKNDQAFDVILCDLMMPDIDGPQLYKLLRAEVPSLVNRIVFMSGGAFSQRTQGFLEQVQPRMLDKPASASLLEQSIQRVMTNPVDTAELPVPGEEGPPTRSF